MIDSYSIYFVDVSWVPPPVIALVGTLLLELDIDAANVALDNSTINDRVIINRDKNILYFIVFMFLISICYPMNRYSVGSVKAIYNISA